MGVPGRWRERTVPAVLRVFWRPGLSDQAERGCVGEEGSTLVEFAVTLPTLFAFLFCFINICLLLYSYEMISQSAREGTRYAMVRGASCPTSTNPTCEVRRRRSTRMYRGRPGPTWQADHNSKYHLSGRKRGCRQSREGDGDVCLSLRVAVCAEQFLHHHRARRRRRLSSRWESCG